MRTLLLFLLVSVLMVLFTSSVNGVPSESLVLYLTFDGTRADIARDCSRYGNDGVIEGDPKRVAGKFGKALELNGTTDYVRIPKSGSLSFGKGSFTAEAWVNLSVEQMTGNAGGRLINDRGTGAGGSYEGWQVKVNNMGQDGKWGFNDSGIDDATGNYGVYNPGWNVTKADYDNGEWHYVAVVYEAGVGLRFYVNGELDGEAEIRDYGSIDNDLPVCIGAAIAHNGQEGQQSQYFPGIIDEVRVWKIALSQDELKANMEREPEFFIAVIPLGKLFTSWGMIRDE
jgi:hypothetical protein